MDFLWIIATILIASFFWGFFKGGGSGAAKHLRYLKSLPIPTLPQPIPEGFQIYAKELPLAGSKYKSNNKIEFATGKYRSLRLEREPDNAKDPNAILVIGECTDDEFELGYLPKDLAAQIAKSNLFSVVQPRLLRVYVGDRGDGYVNIQYQLIGPKADKPRFDAAAC